MCFLSFYYWFLVYWHVLTNILWTFWRVQLNASTWHIFVTVWCMLKTNVHFFVFFSSQTCFFHSVSHLVKWWHSSFFFFFLSLGSKTSESSLTPYFFSHQCTIYLCILLALPSNYSLHLAVRTTSIATPQLLSAYCGQHCFRAGKHFCHCSTAVTMVL